jgi:hypothetical protein
MSHSPQTPRPSFDPDTLALTRLAGILAGEERAAVLHQLAALLTRQGARIAATTVYRQLCLTDAGDAASHIGLANLLHEAGEPQAAWHHYQAALDAAPGTPEAHQGLGNLCAARGDTRLAWAHWRAGYTDRVFNIWATRGTFTPIRVLLLISIVGGNVRARTLIDDAAIDDAAIGDAAIGDAERGGPAYAVTAVHMEFFTPAHELPPHDLVFNAIGDADLCGPALAAAVSLVARTTAPVINAPAAVARTGRLETARRLGRLEGVVCPAMVSLPRAGLTGAALEGLGLGWPVLLRAPGFHTGQHFERVATPGEVADAASGLPGQSVLAMECLDARGSDGAWRKGRVMIIGGVLYPLHWAVSRTWKVHYFTAGMAGEPAHRAEEARFLADMAGFVGARAMAGLAAIGRTLGLDYAGVDFAVRGDGAVMVFEANAAMVILAPPEGPMWDYRRPAYEAALGAARGLLKARKRLGETSRPPPDPPSILGPRLK